MSKQKNQIGSGMSKSIIALSLMAVVAVFLVLGLSKIVNVQKQNVDKEIAEQVQNIGESVEEHVSENPDDVKENDKVVISTIETELGEKQILVSVGDYEFENISTYLDSFTLIAIGDAQKFKIVGYSDKGKDNASWKSASIYEYEFKKD